MNIHKDDPKKLWRCIRNLWLNTKKKKWHIDCIGNETDPSKIAELLNCHLSTIGEIVQSDIEREVSLSDFPIRQMAPVLELSNCMEKDLHEAIIKLSASKACCIDGITVGMIKTCMHEIAPVSKFLFNKSSTEKVLPTLWKTAPITPIFKSDNKTTTNNYHPISILSVPGKLLKRLVHNQCYAYMTKNDLFNDAQSGFRKGRSMGTCLSEFSHQIYDNIDRG